MAYPPEFSSTATYENRYDLDEIDVFLEGNSVNPMYFSISGLPNYLSFGKHYFYLSILDSLNQDYMLRPNSRILFEFKSVNNVIIKSDVTHLEQRNGVATCYVEVLQDPLRTMKEIEDGMGTLTVVGSLANKEGTQNMIPEKFLGAMNYRCTFPIQVSKNLMNADSPILTNTTHKTETIKGQYSFSKATISPMKTSTVGMTYSPSTGQPNRQIKEINTEGGGSSS